MVSFQGNEMKYAMVLVFCLAFAVTTASADVTETRDYNFELKPGGRISLSNVNGDIHIAGASGNEVHVIAKKKAASQEYLDGLQIEVDSSDDLIRIETHHPENRSWFHWGEHGDSSGSVSFELTVPSGVELDTIETVNGGISIAGVKGPVSAETVNGKIAIEGLEGNAKLDTVNGTIDVQFDVLQSGQRVSADAVNGRIILRIPKNASAQIHAETVNGGIDADDFGLKPEKGFVGRDLDGKLGDGEARVNIDTVNGSVTIRHN